MDDISTEAICSLWVCIHVCVCFRSRVVDHLLLWLCGLNRCLGFTTCAYMQANYWMQWLHNLRQSFSIKAFIEHMWERFQKRGGHWKKEASSHGRYSSHFLIAVHLTASQAPCNTSASSGLKSDDNRASMQALLMHTITMFPPDIQELLKQEMKGVAFPTRRTALCTSTVSY